LASVLLCLFTGSTGGIVLQQKFFDSELLQQSLELAESLDRFHFFMNENHLEQAETEITKIAEQHQRPFVFKNMYWLQSKKISSEGKVYSARKLVEIEPTIENQFLLANALTGAEQEREALEVLHQIVDQTAEPSWLLYSVYKNIGSLYLRCKDFEAAEEYYNRAYAMNKDDLNLELCYGYLYLHAKRLEEAKSRFASILERDAEFVEASIGLALVHAAVGEYDLSCANLSNVLDHNPTHKLALYLHFNWSQQGAASTSTIDLINGYLKENPQDEEALTLRVGWYIKQQNFKKAYEALPVLKKNFKGDVKYISQLEQYLRDSL
jgi:tetratricopeptide (TPR) repeat protein